MKKGIIRLCVLSLTLLIISSIVILINGKTITTSFDINNNIDKSILKAKIKNYDGEGKIIEEKIDGNKYLVKLKSIKPGSFYLFIEEKDFFQERNMYVHKSMIITEDNFFGRSTASEIIPISLLIVLIYSLFFLIKTFKKSMKSNIFQYRNVALLGIIIFISLFAINVLLSIFNYSGLFQTINNSIHSLQYVSFFLLPIAFITSILVSISNIILIKNEGMNIKNLLGLFLGLFLCIFSLLPDRIYIMILEFGKIDIFNLNSPGPYIYDYLETLLYLIISYLECILLGTIIVATRSVKRKHNYDKDYIIILGCMIKKDGTLTPLLKGRVDKALEFRNQQLKNTGKDLVFITSGGQGSDEIMSEAKAMKNYLIKQGIKEDNIQIDDKSTNTYENIKFSNKLIKEKNKNIMFSTTNYHVFRTGLIGTKQGLTLDGIGSKTKTYFWINAFIREFIGTIYEEKKKHLIIFSLINVLLIIMIYIIFLANNI